jgi:hypothetical protein
MAVVDLTIKRLERLERQQKETNQHLIRLTDQINEGLGHVADVLEVHSGHFERMEHAMLGVAERVDRLTTAIARGRTRDLARFDDHERRIRALERRGGPKRRKS